MTGARGRLHCPTTRAMCSPTAPSRATLRGRRCAPRVACRAWQPRRCGVGDEAETLARLAAWSGPHPAGACAHREDIRHLETLLRMRWRCASPEPTHRSTSPQPPTTSSEASISSPRELRRRNSPAAGAARRQTTCRTAQHRAARLPRTGLLTAQSASSGGSPPRRSPPRRGRRSSAPSHKAGHTPAASDGPGARAGSAARPSRATRPPADMPATLQLVLPSWIPRTETSHIPACSTSKAATLSQGTSMGGGPSQ